MSKIFKIVLMVCAIVLVIAVSGSMIYYFAFAKPGNERAKLEAEIKAEEEELAWEKEKLRKEEEQREEEEWKEWSKEFEEKQAEASKQEALSNCLDLAWENWNENLDNAYKDYVTEWNYQCKDRGLASGCRLPFDLADRLDKDLEERRKRADEIYESNKEDCQNYFSD